jgi:crotonobetainyl-CoA:carnitine CoA-transferase CaiB-like acyl-CoA transferase
MKDLGVDAEATEIYRTGREALYLIASRLTTREFFVGAQTRGIACGAVYAPDEALLDDHFRFRGYPVEVDHPELDRTYTYPGVPFTGAEIPESVRRAPLVGEHTDEVLAALPDS